jgi:ATP-dependent Lon protease
MATALYSLFTDRPVLPRVAVTGEITLSGAVLAVGGIKAKVLAAKRAGVRTVILPEQNAANVAEDVPPHLREGMEFQFVHGIEDVLALAVGPRGET